MSSLAVPTIEHQEEKAAPSVAAIFLCFLMMGVSGFGGVLPIARDRLVNRTGWMTSEEFTELFGLCQLLPGGNIINMAVALGLRYRGLSGALAAVVGLLAVPSIFVIALGAVYERFHEDAHVRHVFAGLAATGAGLLVAASLRMAEPLKGNARAIIVACGVFIAVAVFRLPLAPTIVGFAPLSLWLLRKGGL